MVAFEQIKQFCDQIVNEFKPDKIILFGSYAYGQPTEDSDVDLMVVMPYEGHPAFKAGEIKRRLRPQFSLDLLVRSPQIIQQRLDWHDFFMMDVVAKGKILYDSDRN
jgi:predicted nucleotidyltransferase